MLLLSSLIKIMFFNNATRKIRTTCKISTFFEDLSFLNSMSHLKLSQHPAKFSGHWYFGKVDITILVCHLIIQDHVIKMPFDLIGRSPSWQVTVLSRLVATDTLVGEIYCFLVCHVISKDHLIKEPCDFMSRSPSRGVTILRSVVAIGTLVMEI